MKVNTEGKIPIKMWLEDIEDGAMDQAVNLANLPFAFKHVALMPDCHQGYGMPIGGVLATEGAIIPNAVGVDIGCGMCAVKTNIPFKGERSLCVETLKDIMSEIRKIIPVGFNKHKEEQDPDLMPKVFGHTGKKLYPFSPNLVNVSHHGMYPVVTANYNNALKSLGTLGGGNHFIEIQRGSDGFIWIMIHSGSRNLGLQVAKYYNDMAKALNKEWHSLIPDSHDLAFLPLETKEAQNYIEEMSLCVEYALANRKLMMDRVKEAFKSVTGRASAVFSGKGVVEFDSIINIAHNYATMENHFGQNVMVHRKGATSAKEGEIGIIPGSQGTKSYIVKGKGNKESFMSCSHGAGRLMGRKQAQRELNIDDEKKILDDLGVIHSIRSEKDLDEAPSAYKDIDTVMANQKELVDIVVELTPLAVIKG